MANASDVIAGAAFVKISLDNAELNKGLAQSQSKMKRFVAAINAWGTSVGLNAAMIQAPFLKALNVFTDFDLKMRQVKAITGATGQAFAELSDKARKLGRETSFTTSQVSDAMVMLSRLGFSVREVKNAVRPVMNLAKATGSELSDAAMTAGNNMRVFGLKAENMEGITDVVVTTVNKSAQSLQDFAEASAKAGPNFVNTGSNIEEMSASLGILANMGIRGAIAGTALSRSIKRLADPRVAAFLKTYGIDIEDANRRMKPLHENLAQIARVMNTLSHAERIHLAEEIFEVRGSLAGLPLVANTEAIDKFLASLRNCRGEAARVAEEMDAGIYGALKRLESAFNDMYISIGKAFSFSFIDWIKDITKFVNKMKDATGAWNEMLRYLMQTGTVLFIIGSGAKLFSMWGVGIKSLFMPIFKLNDLLAGTARRQQEIAEATHRRTLEDAADAANKIAAEKAVTASTLAEAAKRARAHLMEAKAREQAARQELTAEQTKAASADTKIAKANSDYTRNYGELEGRVAIENNELKTLQATNRELEKQVTYERQSLDVANDKLIRSQKNASNAWKEAEDARKQAEAASNSNAANASAAKQIEEKRKNAEDLDAIHQKAQANAKFERDKAVALKNDLLTNEQAIKKKEAIISSHQAKVKSGQGKIYSGLVVAEQKRLTALKTQNVELTKQLNLQQQVAKNAEISAQQATKDAAVANSTYNALAKKSAGKADVDVDSLNAVAAQKQILAKAASDELDAAQKEADSAKERHQTALQKLNDNAKALASSRELVASDTERLVSAQQARNVIVTGQQEIKATAQETTVALNAQVKALHAQTAEATKAASVAQRAANAASAEAERAKTKAAEATKNATDFGGRVAANPDAANLVKAQEEKAAAERIVAEKQVTLAKAQEARVQAQMVLENTKTEVKYIQGRLAYSNQLAQAQMQNAQAQADASRMNIYFQKEQIENDQILLASEKAKLMALQEQRQAYVATANKRRKAFIESGKDVNMLRWKEEIAQIQATIASIEQRIAVEKAGLNQAQVDTQALVAQQKQLCAGLQDEINKRSQLAAIGNKKVGNAGLKAYFAADKEIQAQVELERANERLEKSTKDVALAQEFARTKSQRYAKALTKGGLAHSFALMFSKRHYKQILQTSAADVYAAARTAGASKVKAAGYAAEAVAAKGAANAAIALNAAQKALVANVFTVGLVALSGTIALLNREITKAAEKANALANAHRVKADAAAEDTEKTRKVISEEQEQIKYLVELEKQGNVTAEQQEAAQSIIDTLKKKYSGLNIEINRFTGNLTGAFAAQKRLNEEQKQTLLEKQRAQLKEEQEMARASLKGQFANARDKSKFLQFNQHKQLAEMLRQMGFQATGHYTAENKELDYIEKMSIKQIEKFRERIFKAYTYATGKGLDTTAPKELLNALDKVLQTRREIEKTKGGDLTGEGRMALPTVQAPSDQELENARKKLADIDEKNSLRRVSALERETSEIAKQKKEYMEYLDLLKRGADAKRQQAYSNRLDAQSRIQKDFQKIKDLRESDMFGENQEEISRLNSEIVTLRKNIQRYSNDMVEQEKALRDLQAQRANAEAEYERQLQFARSENEKRQRREYVNNMKLVNDWIDPTGQRHRGTLFEAQEKQFKDRAENERFQNLMQGKDYSGAMRMIQNLWNANSKSIKEATDQYNELLRQARENGYYNGTMSEQNRANVSQEMNRQSAYLQELVGRDTQLRERYDEARKAASSAVNDERRNATIGSFSANALSRAIGSDGTQVKILRSQEDGNRILAVVSTNLNRALLQIQALNTRLGTIGG